MKAGGHWTERIFMNIYCFSNSYFRKPVNIFCEFIPQVIFLMSIFGYMNLLIIAKWIVFDSESSGSAPSILITLINMFMQKYDDPNDPAVPENLKPMYSGQSTLQTILVLMAVICIPWMLAIKPWILKKENDRKVRSGHQHLAEVVPSSRLDHVPQGREDDGLAETGERRNGSLAQLKSDEERGVVLRVEEPEKGEGGDGEKVMVVVEKESHDTFELGDVIIHQVWNTFPHFLPSFHPSLHSSPSFHPFSIRSPYTHFYSHSFLHLLIHSSEPSVYISSLPKLILILLPQHILCLSLYSKFTFIPFSSTRMYV